MSEFKRLSKVLQEADGSLFFECPGCDMIHGIGVTRHSPPHWTWNGNVDKPTFSPSVLVEYPWKLLPNGEREQRRCHSFVVDGQIQYLGDCTHHLAGKTIDMVEIED